MNKQNNTKTDDWLKSSIDNKLRITFLSGATGEDYDNHYTDEIIALVREHDKEKWISVEDKLPPLRTPFMALWMDGDVIDGLELYTWVGGDEPFLNLNSNNFNELGGEGNIPMFGYWKLPATPQEKQE